MPNRPEIICTILTICQVMLNYQLSKCAACTRYIITYLLQCSFNATVTVLLPFSPLFYLKQHSISMSSPTFRSPYSSQILSVEIGRSHPLNKLQTRRYPRRSKHIGSLSTPPSFCSLDPYSWFPFSTLLTSLQLTRSDSVFSFNASLTMV